MLRLYSEPFIRKYLIKRLAVKNRFFKQSHIQLRLNQMSVSSLEDRILEEYGIII